MDVTLSRRQWQIVSELRKGSSNKEIAYALGLTEGTVKEYLHKIKVKAPILANRYAATEWAHRDHERVMAIALNRWIITYGDVLGPEALAALKEIMAKQVLASTLAAKVEGEQKEKL